MNPELSKNTEEETLLSLTKANHELLVANNELLHTINKREIRQFWFKIVWYVVLLGLPLFAYYYLYNAFMSNFTGSNGESNLNYELIQEALKLYQSP